MYATQEKKFKSVSMLVWIGFFTWITCHGVLSFIPDALPCSLFGKFGDDVCRVVKEYNYGIKIAYIAVWIIHVFESSYALLLSSYLGCSSLEKVKWFSQTMISGSFSLSIIREMTRKSKHK
ncbi:uncharacterized protein LOC124452908 isoform X2 [Xenia sp. Carnegie-2017]|uniref:uncharacterized protein LOC124452908 isoform X2 n=1 Tax=Xenia sp. Carnegie-2017 TaxID=2897299 RepID=UPI001F036FD2|nr:uncharacterized protein LOC124452908 isoform X2 [Xenia sp. Carnegie-2017]